MDHAPHRPVERKHYDKIGNSMNQVKGNPGNPPGKCRIKPAADTAACDTHEKIWQGASRAKGQTVYSRNHRPQNGGIILSEYPCDHHKKGPYVQIGYPPHMKSEQHSLCHCKDKRTKNRLSAQQKREHNGPERDQFHVWQKIQRSLAHLHHSDHHAKQGNITDRYFILHLPPCKQADTSLHPQPAENPPHTYHTPRLP